jgi:predicted HTH transcriptional regulator
MAQSKFWLQFGDQESMTVEFKQQLQRASRMQEPMVAFANSRGGMIFVGISDRRPRQILGVVWPQELIEQVQEAARSTQPPLQSRLDDGRSTAATSLRSR